MRLPWVPLLLWAMTMPTTQGELCSKFSGLVPCPAAGSTYLEFSSCENFDDNLADLASCLDDVGRSGIITLDISLNNYVNFPVDLFAGMTSVRNLYLDGNKLISLKPGLFAGLTSLSTLFLDGNKLISLKPGLFAGLTSLSTLNIQGNVFTTLPEGLFDDMPNLESINLEATEVECVPDNPVLSNPAGHVCACTQSDDVLCGNGKACVPGVSEANPGYTCLDTVDPDAGTGGDPHMIGLSGQTIDWKGEDGGWYALLSDAEADFLMSVRLTAPLPVEFPERQLMTGFAIRYEGGHSVVIEIKDPYTTKTSGCPKDLHRPCLSENAIKLTVNGEEHLAVPAESMYLEGGAEMMASNLPAECRPYGGDAIWAEIFSNMASQRHLAAGLTLDEWVLGWSASTAAPAWCEKFVADFGAEGLLQIGNKHTAFNIKTPPLIVRLHSGTNHQGGEVLEDGRILPHLEFWQMDVHIEYFDLDTDTVTGILGETVRPILDEADQPIMSGSNALRGEVEDYRISGSLMSDFNGFHEE